MKIGFIGLGIMGKAMAVNLAKAGHELYVMDHHKEHIDAVTAFGAHASDYAQIGEKAEAVITMLPNSPQVKEVMLGENGLGAKMHAGQVFIDCSSINPLASKEIGAALAERGIEMLDAPVSGGEPKAIDGTLSFMVGGRQEVFDRFVPILKQMGTSVVRCGDLGAGNTTKLANQVIVAANIAAVAEGFMLAKKAGVDPNTVFQAIRGGLAGSTVMDAKGPMMLANNTAPGFRIDLHIKDLNNAIDTAHEVGAPLPLTSQTMEMMQYLKANGMEKYDHSALAKYYEHLANENLFEDEK
jgi:2-hydroxy-3-oxopropionate reductase